MAVVLLLVVGALCALTGSGAIAAAAFGNELLALGRGSDCNCVLVITRSFGHAELNLLTNRVRRFAGSLVRRPKASALFFTMSRFSCTAS